MRRVPSGCSPRICSLISLENQLRSRLVQHFVNENKDRSIFRKNIGRALLNKAADPYLAEWERDRTSREARAKFGNEPNVAKRQSVEKDVTGYLQANFSFVVLDVVDADERLDLESKMISTVSLCEDCKPSSHWLGLSSPKEKIRTGGLWLVNQMNKVPLSLADIPTLVRMVV